MTNYNDGKWHGWNGGECPLHPKTLIDARYDNPEISVTSDPAGTKDAVRWKHTWEGKRIVAFRVIKEHRDPLQTWMKQNEYGDLVECGFDEPGAVLFREVLE